MAKNKLTTADEKFISAFLKPNFDAKTITRTNSYSGVKIEVDPISAEAIDFTRKVYIALKFGDKSLADINPKLKSTNAISYLNRARLLVLKLNPLIYSVILD
jgi:hypothetical protein